MSIDQPQTSRSLLHPFSFAVYSSSDSSSPVGSPEVCSVSLRHRPLTFSRACATRRDGRGLLTLLAGHRAPISGDASRSVSDLSSAVMPIRFEFEVNAAYAQDTWKFRVLGGLHPPIARVADL